MQKNKYVNTKVEAVLLKALEAEAIAYLKYIAFAGVAKKEGLNIVSMLFEDIAKQELEHGKIWLKELGMADETKACLQLSIDSENMESKILYPEYSKIAREEGFEELANKFELVSKVEKSHKEKLECLKEKIESNNLFSSNSQKVWVCMNCGHIEYRDIAPNKCPLCDHMQGYFKEIKE